MEVYKAITDVAGELAARGISKDGRNAAQGFSFRGIDAVYNALAPLLAKHKLCILPRCVDRICVERTTAKGTALFYVTVKAEFDLVSAVDGTKHTIATFGEAMDSGDKATNKAMSAAYKYAAFQAFCIPTEETSADADSETHSVIYSSMDFIADMDAAKTEAELKTAFAAAWKASKGNETIKSHYEKLKKGFAS